LRAPHSETYTFFISGDDGFRVFIDMVLKVDRWNTCCDDMTMVLDLTQNVFYDVVIEFRELQENSYFKMEWSSPQIPRQVVHPQYLFYTSRVGGNSQGDYTVEIATGPTITGTSTIEYTDTALTAGKLAVSTFQSRDTYGKALANSVDNYQIEFVGPGTLTTGNFYATSTHILDGFYRAQYFAQIAGTYAVSVKLTDAHILGSPYTAVVSPGEVKAILSYVTTTPPTVMEAGITLFFSL
jgi:hypothetical protein